MLLHVASDTDHSHAQIFRLKGVWLASRYLKTAIMCATA